MHTPALDALARFAAEKPGLQFANYGDAKAYNQESRRIRADLRRFQALHLEALQVGVTDQDVLDAAPRAFSGRLQFKPVHVHTCQECRHEWFNETEQAAPCDKCKSPLIASDPHTYRIEYTPGQYYPIEYRAAALAVVKHALSTRRQKNPPVHDDLPDGIAEMRERNGKAGSHYFEVDSFFGSYYHAEPFPGCVIESAQPPHAPRFYRPLFVRANGETWRPYPAQRFDTEREALAEAHRMNKAGEIKWKAD